VINAQSSSDYEYEVIGFSIGSRKPKYYESLTHIAWFALYVNSAGDIIDAYPWPSWLVSEAHSHNVKVLLTVEDFDPSPIDTDSMLKNYGTKLAQSLSKLVEERGADGIMVDFEHIGEKEPLNKFMETLYTQLKEKDPSYYVSIALPPWDWKNTFDCSTLANYVDSFFIMAYDYDLGREDSWPTSPLEGGSINVKTSIAHYLSQADSRKFILGLPLYFRDWIVEEEPMERTLEHPKLKDRKPYRELCISVAIEEAKIYKSYWSDETKTNWYKYKKDNEWHQCWFDDVRSLSLKFDFALEQRLRGVGFWHLGCERADVYIAWAIKIGLSWLEEHQNPEDGSWSGSVGITSLATLAFLNAGYDETYPTVKKAIQYILAHQNPDGSFGWGTYETSTAVWALVATHNPDYHDEISAAKDWLIKAQSDEEDGTPPDDPCYGGWRYGISSHDGDLSNTQFALMALDAAYTELGLKKPDPNDPNGWVFKAIKFISRCQNRPASNDQPWAHDTTQPSYNDGGFIYHPRGWSLAGGTKSYGSMTAAGIWSLRLCGVDVNDGRIQDALKWLAKNEDGSFDDNPGHPYDQPHCFLYYYYLTFAKALTMCFLQKLGEVDWYAALSTKLIDLQNNDGHWVNTPAAHGWEDIPDLATSYAILSLQVRQIPAEIKSLSWLTIILRSNADLHVYDPLGRHVGRNYETGKMEIQIPNATYIYDEFQSIKVPELESGNYRIVLVGTGNGSYTLNVTGGVGNTTVSKYSYTGSITKGEVHDSIVDVAMITWLTIHVEKPIPVEAMVRSSTGTGNVSFISDAGTIEDLTAINESKLPAEGKPALSFPHGFFSFNITGLAVGQTVNVTIFLPSNIPVNAQYWKYQTHKGWYQIPIRSNDGDNIIIIQLTDGGKGDDDGIANGVIVDAGGPGIPIQVPKPSAAVVPTLSKSLSIVMGSPFFDAYGVDRHLVELYFPSARFEPYPKYVDFYPYVIVGGPFVNPNSAVIAERSGIKFGRDYMDVNGTVYRSEWGHSDYAIVLMKGWAMYVMGTHRYGTEAALLWLSRKPSFYSYAIIKWVDINGDKGVDWEEVFEVVRI
jgi:squalene-hopene/tetraprenyl-beta-curcumene cyclase